MKKIIIMAAVMATAFTTAASAQPRAAGLRLGCTGFELSYQHSIEKNFIEAEAGLDFGIGGSGFKVAGLYNFMLARPAWTDRGSWGLYAGPGLSLGYVSDRITYTQNYITDDGLSIRRKIHPVDHGFMFAFTGQIGLEYTFWFPLQLSFDIRPYFGLHVSDSKYPGVSRAGFYESGMYGFIPTLSVRYRF